MDRKDAQSILDGLLLGDANLDLGGGCSARFRLSRQASTEEEERKKSATTSPALQKRFGPWELSYPQANP